MTSAPRFADPPADGVRRAVQSDMPRLFEIRNAARENKLADPWETFARVGAWFVDNGLVWAWVQQHDVIGFGAADPRNGWIEVLYVDPTAEGHGIGQALLLQCCDDLREAGHRLATLCTESGTRAERFYLAGGWTAQGKTDRGEILLTKPL
jgi:GNAT superfamily N-acetyltransferase